MASKMNFDYVKKDGVEENLRAIRNDEIITAYMVNINEHLKCTVQQSSSQYVGIIISINHVYILARVKIP